MPDDQPDYRSNQPPGDKNFKDPLADGKFGHGCLKRLELHARLLWDGSDPRCDKWQDDG